jgi:DNA-binding IclR family transcriptional regulator
MVRESEDIMDDMKQAEEDGFERFRQLLFAMRTGDELRASDASHVCGLSESVCRTVLEGLERGGLMTRQHGDRFVRRTLDVSAARTSGSAA